MSGASAVPAGAVVASGVRAYFAPVDRTNVLPVPFDPAAMGRFAAGTVPAGWMDVGRLAEFRRGSSSPMTQVLSGAPAVVKMQVRAKAEAEVSCTFAGWSKVAMALSSGAQALNLLAVATGVNANASGGGTVAAETVQAGSTATVLCMTGTTAVQAGDVVVVDIDYAGETGYVGSGAVGAYATGWSSGVPDVHWTRRVSFNVQRVLSVQSGVVTLAAPLMAGVPRVGMKLARVMGFVDREGGPWVPEWSGLFVVDGVQGDRVLWHYPRLQPAGASAAEVSAVLAAGPVAGGLERWRLSAQMRALPVVDANDGVSAVCFRSYLPAAMRLV